MEQTDIAYIAGFLDGDGSIFVQLIRKTDYRFGFQIRPSLAFYQKTDNEQILVWLHERLGCGSLRRRKTGISDYTIVEPAQVARILRSLQPYVRLKRPQIRLCLDILDRLPAGPDPAGFLAVCIMVDQFRDLNYSKKRTVTSASVRRHLIDIGALSRAPLSDEVFEPVQEIHPNPTYSALTATHMT